MGLVENTLIELSNRLDGEDKLIVQKAAHMIEEFRAANDRLRRENEALRLDNYFLDKSGRINV